MNDNSLMEKFADPALISSLSINDKMTGSLISILIGIGMTFLVLILLWAIVGSMTKSIKTTSSTSSAVITPALPQSTPQAAVPQVTGMNDIELVAVLSAAIAAFEGGQDASGNLIIRKISRIPGKAPAWSSAGRMDCIESRKI